MGDRGNVVIKDGPSTVYLYSHWGGSRLPKTVADALEGGGLSRIDDGPYLARIIFCEMIKNNVSGTTGYGISSTIGDGDETVIINVGPPTTITLPDAGIVLDGRQFIEYVNERTSV